MELSKILQQKEKSNQKRKNNSTVNNKYIINSTVDYLNILNNLRDVCPDDGYDPFYISAINKIGLKRFVYLANKARAGSDTPARLFCWMLKNPELVR